MTFLLSTQPGWRSFKLQQEDTGLERDFDSVAEAFQYARSLPASQGAVLLVRDDKGKDMVTLDI
jgi:hypothetical protein